MKSRYPILSIVASVFLLFLTLPAVADDLDSAVASARGGSLPTLSEAESLAASSARAQAAAGKPFHADLSSLMGICDSVGEVVGMGPNVSLIFEEFAASGAHWSVITASKWTSMGTGQTRGADGYLYISVVFCQGDTPPATTAPPATTPTTAPPSVTAPAPTSTTVTTWASLMLIPFDREFCPLDGDSLVVAMADDICVY